MQDVSPRELVVLFSNVRSEMIALVSGLTQDELSAAGQASIFRADHVGRDDKNGLPA